MAAVRGGAAFTGVLVEAAALCLFCEYSVRAPRGGSRPASSRFHPGAAAGAAKNKTRDPTVRPGTARSRSDASATGVEGWARFNCEFAFASVFTGR